MKLNLIRDDQDTFSGYLNVNVVREGLDLNKHVDDGECEEIRAHLIVNLLPGPQVEPFLNHLTGKLAHKGVLTLSVPEIAVIAYHYTYGNINLVKFNELTYPSQCFFDSGGLVDFFESRGFKVLNKRIHDFMFYLTVERP